MDVVEYTLSVCSDKVGSADGDTTNIKSLMREGVRECIGREVEVVPAENDGFWQIHMEVMKLEGVGEISSNTRQCV